MEGKYVKVVGLKIDAIEGTTIVDDFNAKDFCEAGEKIGTKIDTDAIYIGIPCTYKIN